MGRGWEVDQALHEAVRLDATAERRQLGDQGIDHRSAAAFDDGPAVTMGQQAEQPGEGAGRGAVRGSIECAAAPAISPRGLVGAKVARHRWAEVSAREPEARGGNGMAGDSSASSRRDGEDVVRVAHERGEGRA